MKAVWRLLVIGPALLGTPDLALAGAYLGTAACDIDNGCRPGHPVSNPNADIDKRGISYPLTFTQDGVSSTNLRVCVEVDGLNGNLTRALQWAVEKWNARVPFVNNC